LNAYVQSLPRKDYPSSTRFNPRFSGTDADAIFVQRGGIPTVSIGLPTRYMHSPVEVIDLADLDVLAQLLAGFCSDVPSGGDFRSGDRER
jgi:putative aminopeptidase FrvX